jgi:L-lactate dehydrogenase
MIFSSKVAIVGIGSVGSTIAYTLMQSGVVSELVLIDRDEKKVEGEVCDLQQGIQFSSLSSLHGGTDFDLVKDARIIIITAGIAQSVGQSRDELLQKNVAIFSEIIPRIVSVNKDALLLIVTNPVDVMTTVALRLSGLDSCTVFGTGTVLDSARLRYRLGQQLQISPKDIVAHVLGEHGDAEFVAWSSAAVAGIPLERLYRFSEQEKTEIEKEVKNAAYEIIRKKGATFYAISLVVAKIVRSVLLNQSRLFTLSTVVHEANNTSLLCMSLPTIVTQAGICRVLPIEFSENEKRSFLRAKEHIQELLSLIKI